MKKSKVIIFGSSGHSKVIVDILESNQEFELVGFIDSSKKIGEKVLGYKVIGNDYSITKLMMEHDFYQGVVGIGDNYLRSKLVSHVKNLAPTFKFINCIHKSANISTYCQMGIGNVIMPGVTINAGSILSNHCILNTNSSLDHDCEINEFSSLAPNSVVGGNCRIGKFSNIGIGATVFHGINIGNNCIIGGGSNVNKNTKANSIYYGNPANFISTRKLGDKYL